MANRRFLANRPEYTEIVKLLKQSIAARFIPEHSKRQRNRNELATLLSKKGVGSFGDGRMPLELRHEIGKYLGGREKENS